jgi:sortase B
MRRILAILLVLCLLLVGCGKKTDEELQEELVPTPSEVVKPKPTPEVKPTEPRLSREELERREQEAIYAEASNLTAPEDAVVVERPEKALGYINIPGTSISDWVMWASDNNYFMRKNINEEYDFYGCYYLDQDCRVNPLSRNMTVYGHNMNDNKSGDKFAQLMNYTDLAFINENQDIFLKTTEGTLLYKVVAVMYSDINWNYIASNPNMATTMEMVQEYKARSQFLTDLPFNENDKYITLSTCTYKYGQREDQRFLVIGRLLREGEDAAVKHTFTVNEAPKEPDFDAVPPEPEYAAAQTPGYEAPPEEAFAATDPSEEEAGLIEESA